MNLNEQDKTYKELTEKKSLKEASMYGFGQGGDKIKKQLFIWFGTNMPVDINDVKDSVSMSYADAMLSNIIEDSVRDYFHAVIPPGGGSDYEAKNF